MIRIVIADDHAMMRESLKRIVEGSDEICVVGEAVNGFGALELVRQGGFDVLVLDLSMPGLSGCQLVLTIRNEAPNLPLLLLTMYEDMADVYLAVNAGVNGLLAKEEAGEHLIVAIEEVAAGRTYLPPGKDRQDSL